MLINFPCLGFIIEPYTGLLLINLQMLFLIISAFTIEPFLQSCFIIEYDYGTAQIGTVL